MHNNLMILRDSCCLLQVLMRVESDEHIFKFVKSKFGYGIGRYASYYVNSTHVLNLETSLLGK